MSKYNEYAKKLNAAFTTAAAQHQSAIDELHNAERAKNNGPDLKYEQFPGQRDGIQARLDAEYNQVKAETPKKIDSIWAAFRAKRDDLTKGIKSQIETEQLADPAAYDANAAALLNSGILNTADLKSLAEKYQDNYTMSRLISKAAGDQAENAADPAEKTQLRAISIQAGNVRSDVLDNWDTLAYATAHYSGEYQRHADPEMISRLNKHWTDFDMQETIKNF